MTLQCVDFMQITIRHVRIAQMGCVCVYCCDVYRGCWKQRRIIVTEGAGGGGGGGVGVLLLQCAAARL